VPGTALSAGAGRSTTTGHSPWVATWALTEPVSRPANPPRPREPTTTRQARVDSSTSAAAAPPTTTDVVTVRSGWRRLVSRAMPSSSCRAARSGSSPSNGTSAVGPNIGTGTYPCTRRSGRRRRRASHAPYATARPASADPSTPTTTGADGDLVLSYSV